METNLLFDKIKTIENILVNNEGKNDSLIKFALNELKSMIQKNNTQQNDYSNDKEIIRLKKIIEEKEIQINKLNKELNSSKITPSEKTKAKIGCEHYENVNVFVKCSVCNDFFPCYKCHNSIKEHSFVFAYILRCRYCNQIYERNLKCCPSCNTKTLLS